MPGNKFENLFLFLFFMLFSSVFPVENQRFIHNTYFKNTPNELNVYKIVGRIPNKTMLVIGGIQGDEPTGYLAADLYVDLNLEKGTLIMVPRANFNTIIQNSRCFNGDMNRKFTKQKNVNNTEEKIVEILKDLIAESDVLLNLHEGTGFYRDNWISDMENPRRYGQSIIADAAIFYRKDSTHVLNLEDIAREVIENVNKKISNKEYFFNFNNHNTFSKNTIHAEQRTSATFYALSNFGIPAFGIESSKSISDIETKVRHQIWIINEFMRIFDIVPEVPRIYLDYPELKFIVVTVNENNSVVVPNNKTIYLNKNDIIEINHIESNYKRGLSVDVENYGTLNDFKTKLQIGKSTCAVIKKDKFYCGKIQISVKDNNNNPEQEYKYIVLEINGNIEILNNVNDIYCTEGDIIKIIDTVPSSKNIKNVRINFYGFVPQDLKNRANDRYLTIDTGKDLLRQYSEEGKGDIYRIRVEEGNDVFSIFRVVLQQPKLRYVKIKNNNNVFSVKNGETIKFKANEKIEIIDIDMNVLDKTFVKVNFKGFVGRGDAEDRNMIIPLDRRLKHEYSINNMGKIYPIVVSSHQEELGKVFVEIIN
ncbi:succinylglutamate desuccinylase/aspartoacylase family protein [candidate division KSB1 bacterium]|nr:succinylglutamate desuccinylase/aspartoacylase family protein [candidate division KSB1 bacterium]